MRTLNTRGRSADLDTSGDWRHRARCRGMATADHDPWFPTGTTSDADHEQERAAKAVCQRCPVRLDCLDWAVIAGEAGIWGGMTEQDRRPLRQAWLQRRVRVIA